jgi:hypothetical protein
VEIARLGWAQATLIQTRLSAIRMMRGRTIWVAWIFALLPIAFTVLIAEAGTPAPWPALFRWVVMLAAVLGPLFMASSMAEEIEDRTFTYLWSRPIARWTVVLGKLLAAAPISGGILALTVTACYFFAEGGTAAGLVRGVAAGLVGAAAACAVSAGTAILMPRAGLGVTYAYLLALDWPVGEIPFSMRALSITRQIRQVAGVGDAADQPVWVPLVWLAGISAVWLALAFWRLSRAEFSTGDK